MRLFEFKDGVLNVREECWGLLPFKAILKKDKSRDKATALKEMLFVYYYCDIKSDYLIIAEDEERKQEIIRDIDLPYDWKIDQRIQDAIDFYTRRSETVLEKLYKDALKSANDVGEYLRMTDVLLRERTDKGGTVTTLPMIVAAQEKLPKIMQNLKAAEKEILKEKQEMEGRTKGSKTLNVFEEGFGEI